MVNNMERGWTLVMWAWCSMTCIKKNPNTSLFCGKRWILTRSGIDCALRAAVSTRKRQQMDVGELHTRKQVGFKANESFCGNFVAAASRCPSISLQMFCWDTSPRTSGGSCPTACLLGPFEVALCRNYCSFVGRRCCFPLERLYPIACPPVLQRPAAGPTAPPGKAQRTFPTRREGKASTSVRGENAINIKWELIMQHNITSNVKVNYAACNNKS